MKQRYNIFKQIHKGLRAMLYDTAISLQLTDFSNTDEVEIALEKLGKTLAIFYEHAAQEDRFILPLIARFSPCLVEEFDSEHEKDEFMTHRINNLVNVYRNSDSGETRIEAGDTIGRAFNEFIAFNLYHMNKEEEMINPILWENYSDEGIKEIRRTLAASISADQVLVTSKWMMLGISDSEVTGWLQEVKNNAPVFVFQSLMELAERVLSTNRWNKIQGGLSEGVLLA